MKALKNNSTAYTQRIVTAISDRYATSAEPSNTETMELYSFIGQCICEQGEKAFIMHLAQALTELLPQIKGFSPRNLRRMRDFYRTYENQPKLMRITQTLGWTQNAVILDCCETDEQRAFYLALAAEDNLSKLTLMKAIELNVFETALSEKTTQDTVAAVCPVVGDTSANGAVDTASTIKTACGAFVPACEPSHQGSSLSIGRNKKTTVNLNGSSIGNSVLKRLVDSRCFSQPQNSHRAIRSRGKAHPWHPPDAIWRVQAA